MTRLLTIAALLATLASCAGREPPPFFHLSVLSDGTIVYADQAFPGPESAAMHLLTLPVGTDAGVEIHPASDAPPQAVARLVVALGRAGYTSVTVAEPASVTPPADPGR
ncbi:MAG: hypothetical protein HY608_00615 [Planctomycetes bacterium]|nr:hypothetical protein [Planctomycetota bacterium]